MKSRELHHTGLSSRLYRHSGRRIVAKRVKQSIGHDGGQSNVHVVKAIAATSKALGGRAHNVGQALHGCGVDVTRAGQWTGSHRWRGNLHGVLHGERFPWFALSGLWEDYTIASQRGGFCSSHGLQVHRHKASNNDRRWRKGSLYHSVLIHLKD